MVLALLPSSPRHSGHRRAAMHVIVVDDEPILARNVARLFREKGYGAEHVTSGAALLASLDGSVRYDVMVLDWVLGDVDGIDLVRQVRARGDATPILMLTGRCEPDDVIEAL